MNFLLLTSGRDKLHFFTRSEKVLQIITRGFGGGVWKISISQCKLNLVSLFDGTKLTTAVTDYAERVFHDEILLFSGTIFQARMFKTNMLRSLVLFGL